MFSIDTWREIFKAIQKNKLRTFLTGFTVALGIFIYVSLYGMGNGLNNTFMKFFGDDATNIFRIYPSETTLPYGGYKAKRQIEFKNGDLEEIAKQFAPLIDYVTPQIQRGPSLRSRRSQTTIPPEPWAQGCSLRKRPS
jgi:putative ABC transport system permease protein